MDPPLCAGGCGFFGSAATQNLCSKCYKYYLKEVKEEEEEEAAAAAIGNCVLDLSNLQINNQDVAIDSGSSATVKDRCTCCKKKVGVVGFGCKCGGTFCRIHRYPEEHACKFDFKNFGRAALAKENPVCKADKLEFRI